MTSHEANSKVVQNDELENKPKLNDVSKSFLEDLEEERSRLSDEFPLCYLLIEEAIDRVYSTGRIPGKELYADVLKQKPMKLIQKVFVPVKQYPKFNFVGKILGPKGNSLMRLQDETQCKILIKGRNSMRDKAKEEELRESGDPRYNHLHKDLYLEISTIATPAECYARIAYALAEIRKYLIPDKNDEISHEQLKEIMEIDPKLAKARYGQNPELYKSVFDKTITTKGVPKYLSLLKRTSYAEREELEDENETNEIVHTSQYSNEYMKASPISKGFKRMAAPTYLGNKRVREVISKPYNRIIKT